MSDPFDYFVVLAEMRTGSNFLEANLNAFERLVCHGEAFNPHFVGYPNKTDIFGITQAMRDADPSRMIGAIRSKTDGLGGFRFFRDHDERALDILLADPRCAKIILTRNPLDSYISWKIAQATGQWKLTDLKRRKDGKAVFDKDEFNAHLSDTQSFQVKLQNALQTSGQTAFYISYEDLQNVDVLNGLASFLGQQDKLQSLDKKLKKQNPSSVSDKVSNFSEMQEALSGYDRFNLTRTPNFEPRRGPAVPSYVAAARAPLIYLPIKGGPEKSIANWLSALDGVAPDELRTKMSQKDLRQWKRRHPGHRSFTVLRHPVARVHAAFCERILSTDEGSYTQIRQTLKNRYKIPLPQNEKNPGYDRAAHRDAFVAFLEFLRGNLAGQTAIRVDASWCTQSQAVQGFGEFIFPDYILREDDLKTQLPLVSTQVGYENPTSAKPAPPDTPYTLSDIYDQSIESLVGDIYQRDYMMFGFGPWPNRQAA